MNTHSVSRWKMFGFLFSFLLFFPLVSLACAGFSARAAKAPTPAPVDALVVPTAEVAPVVLPAVVTDEQTALINLYTQVNPSVVNITIYANHQGEMTAMGQGSGFLYDDQGHFLTNAHVVQGAEQIDVTFSDGTISPAQLTGIDLNSDLAVVQVEKIPDGLRPLPLGSMEGLAVGQTMVAIGNPFGLAGTLTRGIISALGRDIPALTQFSIPQSIQTDAAINPGNSGGPLLNLQGEVIGINAQIETGGTTNANSGIGFAIPVSIIKRVASDLVEKGKTEWSYLGVRGGDLNMYTAQAMKLDVTQGAYLSTITPGDPADKANLRGSTGTETVNDRTVEVGGDVIIAVNGEPIRSFDDLLIYIALQTRPGQDVTLTILRDGKEQDVKLTLGARPDTLR